jgi:hypothetical protein
MGRIDRRGGELRGESEGWGNSVATAILLQLAKVIEEIMRFQNPSYSITPNGAVSYGY